MVDYIVYKLLFAWISNRYYHFKDVSIQKQNISEAGLMGFMAYQPLYV